MILFHFLLFKMRQKVIVSQSRGKECVPFLRHRLSESLSCVKKQKNSQNFILFLFTHKNFLSSHKNSEREKMTATTIASTTRMTTTMISTITTTNTTRRATKSCRLRGTKKISAFDDPPRASSSSSSSSSEQREREEEEEERKTTNTTKEKKKNEMTCLYG